MTGIPYCDEVMEVTGGCTKCSPGCQHCWAIKEVWRMAHNPNLGKKWQGLVEKKNGVLNWTGKIKCFDDALDKLRKKPTRYFIDSKADLFHPKVPFEYRLKVFEAIANASQHTYLIFTKRVVEMKEFFQLCEDWDPTEWPNVQLFLSISTQAEAEEKIPIFLQIPAAVRGLSIEPMLGAIAIKKYLWVRQKCVGEKGCGFTGASYEFDNPNTKSHSRCPQCGKNHTYLVTDSVDGVVVGGESGPGARPMHPDWPRNIRDQCVAAGVPFFFKQWGEWLPGSHYKTILLEHNGNGVAMFRVTKKKAGRKLDGKIYNQLPAPAAIERGTRKES